jgi:hypothetical protein
MEYISLILIADINWPGQAEAGVKQLDCLWAGLGPPSPRARASPAGPTHRQAARAGLQGGATTAASGQQQRRWRRCPDSGGGV